jgi:uncharacterized caspase-like protein
LMDELERDKKGVQMKTLMASSVLIILLLMASQAFGLGIKTPPGIEGLADIVYSRGWALIIGVKDYTPSEFQRKYAESDADAVANLIISKYGFNKENVIILKNEDATKQNIMAKINSLVESKKVSVEDCLLIYFSGQAQTSSTEKGEYGFLVPYNANFNLSEEKTLEDYKANCMSIYDFQKALSKVTARHILVVADACLGGILIRRVRSSGSMIQNYLLKVSATKGFQVLVAGENGIKPIDYEDAKHGIFTYNLIKCLEENKADENKDGLTEGSELASYLTKIISDATNGKQKPKFIKTGDGEFLFVPQTETEASTDSMKK